MMTSRERLMSLFQGKKIDKVPVWLLFPYFQSPYYADIFENPIYHDILPVIWENTDTIERYVDFDTGFCYNAHPDIHLLETTTNTENTSVLTKKVVCGDSCLISTLQRGARTSFTPFISEIEDLQTVLNMPYSAPMPDLTQYRLHEKTFGSKGLMGVGILDALTVFHDLCSETDFCLFAFTQTDEVISFLDVIFERIMTYLKYLLDHQIGEVFWITGSEFAVPPMLGPDLFDRLVVHYTKPMCDLIRSYGKFSLLHCHGRIKRVLPLLKEIAFDAIHPLEAPPMGDCTLTEARACLGDECILIGNIQYGDILTKEPDEIEQMARSAIKEGGSGRFILSVTGGPSAPSINERVIENYRRLIAVAEETRK